MIEIPEFHVHMLGGLELFIKEDQQGAPRALQRPPTAKSQSLLAYLILRPGRIVPRELLGGMFWGDRPEARARRSLSTALWHIRRCFPGHDPISGGIHDVRFEKAFPIQVDVHRFETLASAENVPELEECVRLYKGELLEGLYDDWIIDARYVLQEQYVAALGKLMAVYENQSRPRHTLNTARRLLQENPLREDVHRAAMRAYCALGQRNHALEQYQTCQEVIRQELDVETLPETRRLFQDILAGNIEIGQPAPEASPVAPQQPAPWDPFDAARATLLIGREAEMAELTAGWEAARASQGKMVLLKGEAGVGKTFLMERFAAWARSTGGQVLLGRCYEFERLLPYQPLTEAIRPLALSLSAEEKALLPNWVLTLTARLLPELGETLAPPAEAGLEEHNLDPARLFEGLAQLLRRASAMGPVLLVLEDLHWATESTLQFLHYLHRRLSGSAVFVLGTFRLDTDETARPLDHLERQAGVGLMELPRLSAAAVAAWTMELSGLGQAATPLSDWLYRETEGNPFFMAEMIRALFQEGALSILDGRWHGDLNPIVSAGAPLTRGVEDLIGARVDKLDAQTQKALRCAAVMGREFDFNVFEAALKYNLDQALEALEAMLRHRLVEEGTGESGRDYAFSHHKIQEVIYAGLSAPRRARLHKQVGRVMEDLPLMPDLIPELAYHFDQARRLDPALATKAAEYYGQAGDAAAARFANSEALNYFQRALALIPDEQHETRYFVFTALERVQDRVGSRPAQADSLKAMTDLAGELSAGIQGESAIRSARYAYAIGDYSAAITAALRAVRIAGDHGDRDLMANALEQHGVALWAQGDYPESRIQFEEALDAARAAGNRQIEAKIFRALGQLAADVGDYPEARANYQKALERFQSGAPDKNTAQTLGNLSITYRYEGNYLEAQAYLEQSLAVLEQIGDRYHQGIALMNLGVILWDQSKLVDARACIEQALEISKQVQDRTGEAMSLNNLGRLSAELGALTQAATYLDLARDVYTDTGELKGESFVLQSLGNVAAEQGQYEKSIQAYQAAWKIRQEIGDRRGEGYCLQSLGDIQTVQQDFRGAGASFESALEIFREINEQRGEGTAYRGRGKWFAWLGSYKMARRDLTQALDILDSPRDQMTVWVPFSDLCHRMGDHEQALDYAQAALQAALDLENRTFQAAALLCLGHARERLGDFSEAFSAFQQALQLRNDLDQAHLVIEPLAGLARLALEQGHQEKARGHVDEMLAGRPWSGLGDPIRTLLTCYLVLDGASDPSAPALIAGARANLGALAETIPSAELKQSFLKNIPSHLELAKIA